MMQEEKGEIYITTPDAISTEKVNNTGEIVTVTKSTTQAASAEEE